MTKSNKDLKQIVTDWIDREMEPAEFFRFMLYNCVNCVSEMLQEIVNNVKGK